MSAAGDSIRAQHHAHRYQVERVLGRGGMATVYAVLDTASGRRLALKWLASDRSSHTLALFEREFRTLASLRHPGIVRVYDYGTDSGDPYYTMELLEGGDLSGRSPMPWRQVCACLRDAASILGVLHVRRLVHRDLSPKNLWLTPEGRLKILDFGALSFFGPAVELAGTAPMIAPEALSGGHLDARTDIFSLGALGYWLLSGKHAYPARRVEDLADLHAGQPIRAGSLERLLQRKGLEVPPPDLEELIISCLRRDPRERPASTSELVDRLTMLGNLEPEASHVAALSYLQSKPVVARQHELETLSGAIRSAAEGRGQWISLQGEAGSGRSRMLEEASILARVSGLSCVAAPATGDRRPYGVALALLAELRGALPARPELLAHYEALLASLRAASQRQEPALAADTPPRSIVEAWREWWTTITGELAVAVLVDDVDASDAESRVLIGSLSELCAEGSLLLVTTAARDLSTSRAAARRTDSSIRLVLKPVSQLDIAQLLRSIFGDDPRVPRLATWLHGASQGNPKACVRLIETMVESEEIHYRDGMWVLPRDVAATSLLSSNRAGTALTLLSEPARSLARSMSIPRFRPLTPSECMALVGADSAALSPLFSELYQRGVLDKPSSEGSFCSRELRAELYAELAPDEARRLHARLARAQSSPTADGVSLLHASNHFVRAGERRRAQRIWRRVLHGDTTLSFLHECAPVAEDGYLQLVAAGAPEEACVIPLAALAVAGYLVDRRYALEYGDRAIALTHRLLHVSLVRALAPYVGKFVALMVGLVLAATRKLWHPSAPNVKELVFLHVAACSALSGTAATTIDSEQASRYADEIEPFAALGANSAPALIRDFARNTALMVGDRRALSYARTRALLERLQTHGIAGLNAAAVAHYKTALIYCLGVNARFRDDPEVLEIANQLEQTDARSARNANHLRASYFASQGQLARADEALRRVEEQTVELGTAWQTELWIPVDALSIAIRLDDAMMMKRAARELARVSMKIPSLAFAANQARGMYLVMRGKYEQAIALLDPDEEPLVRMGWLRARGMLARALNGLKQHERARAICLDCMSRLSAEERLYVRMGSLLVAIELALAESALGDWASAQARLDELLSIHAAHPVPLTLGAIHEAYVKVALSKGDFAASSRHLEAFTRLVRPTGIPGWVGRMNALEAMLAKADPKETEASSSDPPTLAGRVPREFRDLVRPDHRISAMERAQQLLAAASTLASADCGFVLLPALLAQPVSSGTAPDQGLIAWAEGRMAALDMDAGLTSLHSYREARTSDFEEASDDTLERDGSRYRFTPLWKWVDGTEILLGALVLGTREADIPPLDAILLRAIASRF